MTDGTVVTNSIFTNNKGILFKEDNPDATDTIANCTFYHNLSLVDTAPSQLDGNALISNCIFDQEIEGSAFPFEAANVTLENSLILSPDCSALPAYVNCGSGNLYGLAPVFADAAAGDFHLLPNSPGINVGNNGVVNALGIQTDYDGLPRINFCNVDMGAFEAPDYSLVLQSTTLETSCSDQTNGSVQFQLLNGCAPYNYAWTKGLASGTGNTGLLPGNYAFTITDALGKEIETQVEIPVLSSVEVTATVVNYNCTTGTTGSITLLPTAGTAPYEYEWMDGNTSPDLALLLPGDYLVTVTDALGCTAVDSVTVALNGSLTLGINIQPITCPGDSDGTATVQPIGGTMPFAWLWQGGQTTPTIDGLSGGSYAVTVTDALGCTGDLDFTINPPTAIDISFTTVEPDCNGGLGSASATASGGSPGYEFDWDNGANTASVMLPAGPHTVTVTDAHGCTAIDTISLDEPPLLEANVTPQPAALCDGSSDGSIAVNAGGGTGPYTWGGTLANLAAGTYTVTVTDANGCTATATASIAELDEIAVMDTITDASGPTALDGSIVLTNISGGTGSGYTFLWENGSTNQNRSGIPTGNYTVTVTDSQGCTGEFSFFVDFGSAAGEAVGNPFGAAIVPNPSSSAEAVLVIEKRSADMRFAVLDALGRVVVAEREMAKERQSLPQGLAPGSYFVVLKNGEGTAVLKWIVTE